LTMMTSLSEEMTVTTELTVVQRAAIALQSETASAHLIALAASTKDMAAPTNRAGRDQCHAAAMAALKARTAVTNAAKEARADATAFSKAVIAEEARLVALIEPEEIRLKSLRDAYDAEQERIKREAAQREKARVDAITERIHKMRDAPVTAAVASIEACEAMLSDLRAVVIDESFAEFQKSAGVVLSAATDSVSAILAAKVAAAEESARVKAEQEAAAAAHAAEVAEFNRQKSIADEQRRQERAKAKAEQDERDRIAAEARKAEDARIAAERAALDEERAKFDAEQRRLREYEAQQRAAIEAEEKKLRDAEDAERRRQEEAEMARRAATSAIRKRIDAALDRLDDEALACVADYAESLLIQVLNSERFIESQHKQYERDAKPEDRRVVTDASRAEYQAGR